MIALVNHDLEHQTLAQLGRYRVVNRVLQRILRNRRQHRRFGQRQIARGLAEILLRRRLDAIRPPAVKVGVDVPFENLVFAVEARNLSGEDDFLDLARVR